MIIRVEKVIKIILILTVMPIMISGCFDNVDIDERMIVSPIGIDSAPDQKMLVIFRMPIVRPGGWEHQDSPPNKKNYILRFTTANGILPAVIDAQSRDQHNIFLGHCRALIFGESYARRGLKPAMDFFNRSPAFPLNAYIVIARPGAASIMDIIWPEQELHDQNIRVFFNNRENSKFGIKKWRLYQKIVDPLGDPIVPLVTPSDGATTMKIIGMAVFRKDKMVGELNFKESNLLSIIKCTSGKNRIVVPDSGAISTGFEVATGKKRLKVTYRNNHPVFNYRFKLNAYLIELGRYQPPLDNSLINHLQKTSAKYLQKSLIALLRKLQTMASDPLELGNNFRIQQPKYFSVKKWPEDYRNAEFQVRIDLFIDRVGILK